MIRRTPVFVVAVALLGAGLLLPARALAGELQINPVLVELDGARRSALVTLKNQAQAKARYQVRVFAWEQDDRGAMQLAETKDVVAFPLLVEFAAGETRKIRIGAQIPLSAVEKSYRVFIEEMPPPESPDAPGQVRVLSRIGVPIFLAPTKVVKSGDVAFLSVGGGRAELRIRNTGTVRLRPSEVKLEGFSADGRRTFETPLSPWYVLAGGERRYEAELPADACSRTRELKATVSVEPAPLVATLRLPDGACAR